MSLYEEVCAAQKDMTDKQNEYIKSCENAAVNFFEWFRNSAEWGRSIEFADRDSNVWGALPIDRLRPTGNGNQLAVKVRIEWTGNSLDTNFSMRRLGDEFEINFLGFNSTISAKQIDQPVTVNNSLAKKYANILIKWIKKEAVVPH